MSSFSCEKDADIEGFLHTKATLQEEIGKSRTYLVLDEENLFNGKIVIYGYFALALKVLQIPEYKSNNFRKKLDGVGAKIHGKTISQIPCYLIGQLGKNSNIPENPISGKMLLDFAFSKIIEAQKLVSGRYVLIECHNNEKIINFYKSYDFEPFDDIPDGDTEMVQMITCLVK